MKRSMFLVVAGLVSVGVAANVFAQRPQPKDAPKKDAPKKGPIKGIQPKVNTPKGNNPKGTPIIVAQPPVTAVPTNVPSYGTGPRLGTPVTGYLGGGYNPALYSPFNPSSPVNNPWNYVAPNPWLMPPLNPWSTPQTPWINPWAYGPNFNPLANFNPLVNPFNPMVNPMNPLNPWNSNPWAFNPVNNFGPQFAFPNNNPFGPFGPGANFLR